MGRPVRVRTVLYHNKELNHNLVMQIQVGSHSFNCQLLSLESYLEDIKIQLAETLLPG